MEELKLILETVQGLGVEAKWFAIVWLVAVKVVSPLIVSAVVLTIAVFAYKLIHRSIVGYQFGYRVMALFGGALWDPADKAKALKWLGGQELPKI